MSVLYEPVEIPLWMMGCEDVLSAVVIVNWLFSPCVCATQNPFLYLTPGAAFGDRKEPHHSLSALPPLLHHTVNI